MPIQQGHWEFSGNATIGLWVRRGGVWARVGQADASAFQYGVQGYNTVGWYYAGTHQLGTGIEAFGITMDGTDQQACVVDDLQEVTWNGSGGGGGQRTALPNGSTTTVTVRPK